MGSVAASRNTIQVRADAASAAERIPTFASWSCVPPKASEAISSDTVKPTPPIAPAPATAAQPTGGRSRPRLIRVMSHAAPVVPTGLPTT